MPRGRGPPRRRAGALKGGILTPEEVARRTLRAIERNEPYVLTHPEQQEILRRRAAQLDAPFAPERWAL